MNKNIWGSFKQSINKLDSNSELIQLFNVIKEWFYSNKKLLNEKIVNDYDIEGKIGLNGEEFSIDHSETSVSEVQRIVNSFTPTSEDSIIMFVRDLLYELLVFRTEVECQSCKDRDLTAMYDAVKKDVILVCDVCDWSQTIEGNYFDVLDGKKLIIANNIRLRDVGLI